VVGEGERDRRDRHLHRDLVGLDRAQHPVQVEPAVQPHPDPELERGRDVEQPEDVRRRGGDLNTVRAGQLQGVPPVADRGPQRAMGVDDRLGQAGGAGAEHKHGLGGRVAADDVTIGFNQSRLAIMPAWGGAERLASLVGRPQALLLATTGERIDAAEALRIGLFDRVYPRSSFEESWRSLAALIASSPSRAIKSVIAAAAPHQHAQLEASAAEAFASLWVADAHWAAADGLTRK
jgi:hypothetical protein